MARIRDKDGLPFYEGEEKNQKLKELADLAVSHFQNSSDAWVISLEHARKIGDALVEAKRINGGRSKWTKWLTKNFCEVTGRSLSTAREYMRIAKNWDDPRLQEARSKGMTANSIVSVLKILKGQGEPAAPKPSKQKWEMDEARKALRTNFAKKLKELDYQELKILAQGFEHYFWPKTNNALRDTVCRVFEYDYYYEHRDTAEERRTKRKEERMVMRKVNAALNKKRKKKKK